MLIEYEEISTIGKFRAKFYAETYSFYRARLDYDWSLKTPDRFKEVLPNLLTAIQSQNRELLHLINETSKNNTAFRKLNEQTAGNTTMLMSCRKTCEELATKIFSGGSDDHSIDDLVPNVLSKYCLWYVLEKACQLFYPLSEFQRQGFYISWYEDFYRECVILIANYAKGLCWLAELETLFQGKFAHFSADYQSSRDLCQAGKIHIEHLILYVHFKQALTGGGIDRADYTASYPTATEIRAFLTEHDLCSIFKQHLLKNPGFAYVNWKACQAEIGLFCRQHSPDTHTAKAILNGVYPVFHYVPGYFIQGFETMRDELSRSLPAIGGSESAGQYGSINNG